MMGAAAMRVAVSLSHNGQLAVRLAEHGLFVLPCRNEPGSEQHKKPLIKWGTEASTDVQTVIGWWSKWRDALPAIATKPSGLVVLDGDRHHKDQDGVAVLLDLFRSHGGCPATPVVKTPSGGIHVYFRARPDSPLSNSSQGLPKGIDVKASGGNYGGYVMAPGARLADDQAYEQVQGLPDFWDAMRTKAFPLVPDWLFDIRENAETAGPVDLKSPLPAPGIASDLVKANARQTLEIVATQLAETPTKRGTATFKHAAVMGGWAAMGAITRETVWDEFVKAAKINRHFQQDLPDLARSFDRGFGTGYLRDRGGPRRYPPNQQPLQSQPSSPSGFSEQFPPPLKATQAGFNGTCAPPAGSKAFQVDELLSTPAPKRKWRVYPLVPQAEVTLLVGDGGGGKTTICLQLGMAGVGEKIWFGFTVEPCNVLYVGAEDPKDELHYRLEEINRYLQIPRDKLARFKIIDLSGADATTLATFDNNGQIKKTALFDEVERIAADHNAGLVILDAAADFFEGNENERREVRAFIGLLRGLAMRLDAAIVLIAHPSVDGMKSGRGYSGSTHWNNSVRSRLTFTEEETSKERPPGLDVKVLELAKSNRARRGEKIRMMWNDGQFELLAPGASGNPDADRQAKDVFLQLLKKLQTEGILVVPDPRREMTEGYKRWEIHCPSRTRAADATPAPDRVGLVRTGPWKGSSGAGCMAASAPGLRRSMAGSGEPRDTSATFGGCAGKGPSKGTGGRPRRGGAITDPVERIRLDALKTLPRERVKDDRVEKGSAMTEEKTSPAAPPQEFQAILEREFGARPVQSASTVPNPTPPDEPRCLVSGMMAIAPPPERSAEPDLVPTDRGPVPPPPVLVEDASQLAGDVEEIAQTAIDRIKEILEHPLDRQDPNFAALLRFLSSTYNTSMTTIQRADETRLKRQTVSRLPEILARVEEERRKRDLRVIGGHPVDDTF
jgi:hypothetical protein